MNGSGFADPGRIDPAGQQLAQRLGISFTLADVLARRGYGADPATARYLAPKLAQLTCPDEMADREAAASRIASAIRDREPMAVFGDYDCDGITSVAILTEVIRELGGQVTPHLASRFAGGYGFSEAGLKAVRTSGASLVITCDCGSSDHEQLAAARADGLEAVVIDHHVVAEQPLPAVAFVNPQRPDCGFPYKGLATCGLVLSLAAALRHQLGVALDVRRWLDLVAIGTVADVVPLDGDNRILVRAGLNVLATGQRVGLDALIRAANRGRRIPQNAEDIAFQIAPRINAAGRLGDPMLALRLLLCRDAPGAHALAEQLEQLTQKRREIQRTMEAEALSEIAAAGHEQQGAIVLARQGWHPGVVGIVAGRLAERYGQPTAVVALEGDSGRGSVRGPGWANLYDSLQGAAEHLLGFGGHQAAAGVQIQTAEVPSFRRHWSELCAAQRAACSTVDEPLFQAEARLDHRDDLEQLLHDLEQLEPCGEANPAPRLLISDLVVRSTKDLKGHLKLELDFAGQPLSGFAPDLGAAPHPQRGQRIAVVARLKRDHWRGGQQPELLIHAWQGQ